MIGEGRRDIGVLAVTSADRLNAGWAAAQRARSRGNKAAQAHIESLMADLPPHCKVITVIDGHPATLSWLGSVAGHQTIPMGCRAFRPNRHDRRSISPSRIDADAIVEKVNGLTDGKHVHRGNLAGSAHK